MPGRGLEENEERVRGTAGTLSAATGGATFHGTMSAGRNPSVIQPLSRPLLARISAARPYPPPLPTPQRTPQPLAE